MGRIAAPYAVRGWVKIQPYTEHTDNLLDYPVWQLRWQGEWRPYRVLEAKLHSQYVVAHLEGVEDRNSAEQLSGRDVAVGRRELPAAGDDEYYWDELIGLTVANLTGDVLGTVSGLLETGAHDVLQVAGERERLIPFVAPIVVSVDRDRDRIVVDWGKDW